MDERIWDLHPDDGGDPIQVVVGNANEAIGRDPGRYTRFPPSGTAQADIAQRRTDRDARVAEIRKAEIDRLNEIAKDRQAKLDKIAEEKAAAEQEQRAKVREDNKAAAAAAGEVPARTADIARIEAEAAAAAEKARLETSDRIAEVDGAPGVTTTGVVRPVGTFEDMPVGQPLKPGIPTRPAPPQPGVDQQPQPVPQHPSTQPPGQR